MGDSLQPEIVAINLVFLSLATITTALRFWTRAVLHHPFGADDAFILIAWTLSVAQSGIAIKWTYLTGQGRRLVDVPPLTLEESILSAKMNFGQGLIYNPILGCVKFAIILFLLRLEDKRRRVQWTLWALFALNFGHLVAVFLVVIFQCTPVNMYWNHFKTDQILEDGTVVNPNYTVNIDQAVFSISTAGIAVVIDIAILMVPVVIMWNLRMPVRRKLAVLLVLSAGWVVAVVGAVRIKFFVDMWYGRFADPSHSLWSTLSAVENNVGIMVANLPALKALILRYSPKFLGTSYVSRETGNTHYGSESYKLHSRAHAKQVGRSARKSGTHDLDDLNEDSGSQVGIVKSVSVEMKSSAPAESDERLAAPGVSHDYWQPDGVGDRFKNGPTFNAR